MSHIYDDDEHFFTSHTYDDDDDDDHFFISHTYDDDDDDNDADDDDDEHFFMSHTYMMMMMMIFSIFS